MQVSTLRVLAELKDPHSRFGPYIRTWPKPDELMCACNLPRELVPLLKSEYWVRRRRQRDVDAAAAGLARRLCSAGWSVALGFHSSVHTAHRSGVCPAAG